MAQIEKIAVPIIHLIPGIPMHKEGPILQELPIFAVIAAKKELRALGTARVVSPIAKCEEIFSLEKDQAREGIVAAIGDNLFDRLDFHFLFLYKRIRSIDYSPNRIGMPEHLGEIMVEFHHRCRKEGVQKYESGRCRQMV